MGKETPDDPGSDPSSPRPKHARRMRRSQSMCGMESLGIETPDVPSPLSPDPSRTKSARKLRRSQSQCSVDIETPDDPGPDPSPTKPAPDDPGRDPSRTKKKLRVLFDSGKFQVFITSLIILNTLFMGLELDTQAPAKASETALTYIVYPQFPEWLIPAFETMFSIIFILEFCLKVYAYGKQLFKESATYIDIAAIMPWLIETTLDSTGAAGNVMFLRVIRLMRLFRFLRLIKMCKELAVLTLAIANACKSLLWVALLLFIFMYCSAFFCTILVGHNPLFHPEDETMMLYAEVTGTDFPRDRYFGSIMRSILTLFQVFTLENWPDVARPIVETHQPYMLAFFVTFMFVTTFGLLNLIVGVIVDTTVSAARGVDLERERLLQDKKLQISYLAEKVFKYADKDGNGHLEPDEVQDFLKELKNREILRENLPFEFDINEFVEICQVISEDWFHENNPLECSGQLSPDGDRGVTLSEFIDAAMRLQGTAQSRDVLASRVALTSILQKVDQLQRECKRNRRRTMKTNNRKQTLKRSCTSRATKQLQTEYGRILKEMNAKMDRLSNEKRQPSGKKLGRSKSALVEGSRDQEDAAEFCNVATEPLANIKIDQNGPESSTAPELPMLDPVRESCDESTTASSIRTVREALRSEFEIQTQALKSGAAGNCDDSMTASLIRSVGEVLRSEFEIQTQAFKSDAHAWAAEFRGSVRKDMLNCRPQFKPELQAALMELVKSRVLADWASRKAEAIAECPDSPQHNPSPVQLKSLAFSGVAQPELGIRAVFHAKSVDDQDPLSPRVSEESRESDKTSMAPRSSWEPVDAFASNGRSPVTKAPSVRDAQAKSNTAGQKIGPSIDESIQSSGEYVAVGGPPRRMSFEHIPPTSSGHIDNQPWINGDADSSSLKTHFVSSVPSAADQRPPCPLAKEHKRGSQAPTVSHGINQAEATLAKEHKHRSHSPCKPISVVSADLKCNSHSGVIGGQSSTARNDAQQHPEHVQQMDDQSQLQSQQFVWAVPPGIPAHDHAEDHDGGVPWLLVSQQPLHYPATSHLESTLVSPSWQAGPSVPQMTRQNVSVSDGTSAPVWPAKAGIVDVSQARFVRVSSQRRAGESDIIMQSRAQNSRDLLFNGSPDDKVYMC